MTNTEQFVDNIFLLSIYLVGILTFCALGCLFEMIVNFWISWRNDRGSHG